MTNISLGILNDNFELDFSENILVNILKHHFNRIIERDFFFQITKQYFFIDSLK